MKRPKLEESKEFVEFKREVKSRSKEQERQYQQEVGLAKRQCFCFRKSFGMAFLKGFVRFPGRR